MVKAKNDLTAAEVHLLLIYDPHTGLLQYRERGPRRPRGWWAGARDPSSGGYLRIQIGTRKYLVHRIAFLLMKGRWPNELDHRDLDRTNNRWANLREVTHQQNTLNGPMRSTNKSGFKGVSWHKVAQKWVAEMKLGEKRIYLGLHDSPEVAHEAYKQAAIKYRGEFARWE